MNFKKEDAILSGQSQTKAGNIFKSLHASSGTAHSSNGTQPATIVFVVRGSIVVSFDEVVSMEINKGELFLIPFNSMFSLKVLEDVHVITCVLTSNLILPSEYSIENMTDCSDEESKEPIKLSIPAILSDYLSLLDNYIRIGLDSEEFLEWKKQEMIYLFFYHFEKTDVFRLLFSTTGDDFIFKEFVINNYLAAKSVQELARMANYSTSGFDKKFRRNFNQPPYQWIMEQKSKQILFEIRKKKKSLKEIASEYHFSSYQHFANFCKTQYGYPPIVIRGKKK